MARMPDDLRAAFLTEMEDQARDAYARQGMAAFASSRHAAGQHEAGHAVVYRVHGRADAGGEELHLSRRGRALRDPADGDRHQDAQLDQLASELTVERGRLAALFRLGFGYR